MTSHMAAKMQSNANVSAMMCRIFMLVLRLAFTIVNVTEAFTVVNPLGAFTLVNANQSFAVVNSLEKCPPDQWSPNGRAGGQDLHSVGRPRSPSSAAKAAAIGAALVIVIERLAALDAKPLHVAIIL